MRLLNAIYILSISAFGAFYFEKNVGELNYYAWRLVAMLLPMICFYILAKRLLFNQRIEYLKIVFSYIGTCYSIVCIYGSIAFLMKETGIDYISACGYILVFPITNKVFGLYLKNPDPEDIKETNDDVHDKRSSPRVGKSDE